VDGVEVFKSRLKRCTHCLTRTVSEETEYFHKAMACMTVGSSPHIVLGMEMLEPQQDGSGKDEGEMTGVKRLLKRLNKTHHHFSDVIVADALYMNAPFINLVKGIGMYSVIRAKDTRLNIVQDALGLFKNEPPEQTFVCRKKQVPVWDADGFGMDGSPANIRFLKFIETRTGTGGRPERHEMWCITTLPREVAAKTVWLIMHSRWDIENNGFRMLKTYFHADHCYIHGDGADRNILIFIMIAFNLMELFLFRRLKDFRERVRKGGITRKRLIGVMWDELLLHDYSAFFTVARSGSG
jgi:predicted transposase YbfD/YdcC